MNRWSDRRPLGSLLSCACATCDVNCSSAITSLYLLKCEGEVFFLGLNKQYAHFRHVCLLQRQTDKSFDKKVMKICDEHFWKCGEAVAETECRCVISKRSAMQRGKEAAVRCVISKRSAMRVARKLQ